MNWWLWLLVGLVLLAVELLTPGGFYFMFFGIAALLVGILSLAGLGPDWLLFVIFSGASIGSLALFRGRLVRWLRSKESTTRPADTVVGEIATLMADVPASGVGQAELRGTVWTVENASPDALHKGQRCSVERVDGLKLIVRPSQGQW